MKFLVIGLLCVATLADCGKESRGGNVSVNSDGTCSRQYITDNNEVYSAGGKDASRAKRACDTFRSRHDRTASCNAIPLADPGRMKVFEASTIYDLCDEIDQALLSENGNVPPTLPPPSHDVPTLIGQGIVSTNVTKLKFKIVNPDKLALVKGVNGKFLENGIVVNAAPIGKTDAFCAVGSESDAPKKDSLYKGKTMTEDALPNINHVKIIAVDSQGKNISFLCATSSSLKISLKDIQEVLKGVVDVTDEP